MSFNTNLELSKEIIMHMQFLIWANKRKGYKYGQKGIQNAFGQQLRKKLFFIHVFL
jgi:hypothetical protein